MKKRRCLNNFIAELERFPSISVACEKVGLSRNTIYRWRKEDSRFNEKVERALSMGADSVNDLAESKLISKINKGEFPSIRYWLENNNPKYFRPKRPVSQENEKFVPVTTIESNMYEQDETDKN